MRAGSAIIRGMVQPAGNLLREVIEIRDLTKVFRSLGIVLAVMILGCDGTGDREDAVPLPRTEVDHAGPEIVLDGQAVYYLVELFNPGFDTDRSMLVGTEHREVFATHLKTRFKNVPTTDDDHLQLLEVLTPDRLSDNAVALEAQIKSNFEGVIRRASLPGDPKSAVDSMRVDVLPADIREVRSSMSNSGRAMSREVELRVRELVNPNQQFTTSPIRLNAAYRLAGAVANPTYTGAEVRFSISYTASEATEPVVLWESTVPPMDANSESAWTAFDNDLSALGTSPVTLHFSSDSAEASLGAAPLWGNVHLYATDPAPVDSRPNLLLISLDTVRADRLSLYGYARDTTPNLDRFAAQATVFEEAYAPTSWTLPTHTGLFTGLHPIAQPRTFDKHIYQLSHELDMVAESARRSGYVTAGFTEGILVGGDLNFDQGFGQYDDGPGWSLPPDSSTKTFANAATWLKTYAHLPYVAFVHTYQAHSPYIPSAESKARFAPEAPNRMAVQDPLSPKDAQFASDLYDAEIADMDASLGIFLDRLETSGAMDNTIVIIFSDHGEEFMEHGRMSHGKSLHRESLHVPLIIRMPGQQDGRRVSDLVSIMDLHSTIADSLALDATKTPASLSLLPVLNGKLSHHARAASVSSIVRLGLRFLQIGHQTPAEKYIGATGYDVETSPLAEFDRIVESGTDPHRVLVQRLLDLDTPAHRTDPDWSNYDAGPGVREFFFDLSVDPDETTDRAADLPEAVKAHRAALLDALDGILRAKPGGATPEVLTFTQEEEEALEAIGYLGN